MTYAAIVGGVVAVGSSVIGGQASKKAAQTAANQQSAAAADAANRAEAQRAPWQNAGIQGLNSLQSGLSPGGKYTQKFSMADATNSDAEQFAQKRGAESVQNSAAAKSGLLNSNTMRGLTDNAEATAAQFQNQAFNQWMEQQKTEMAANESLAGQGMVAANGNATDVANASLAAGGAQAGATAAGGQINANMTNSIGGGITGMLGGILGQPGGGGSPSYSVVQPTGGDPYGGGINGVGGSVSAGDFSDERLKDDIIQVGMTNDGLPIYKYKMKGGGGRTQMGVMAQDVERVKPSAVSTHPSGYKMVDYNRVS